MCMLSIHSQLTLALTKKEITPSNLSSAAHMQSSEPRKRVMREQHNHSAVSCVHVLFYYFITRVFSQYLFDFIFILLAPLCVLN